MPDERKSDRHAVRPDATGFTVFEVFTGRPVMVAGTPQSGLSEADARHMADLLNKQARSGDSSMRR